MDPTNKGAENSALSPSMITDYFRSSKPKRHLQKGKSGVKKDNPSSSVYLTPESSPGSHSNPDNLPRESFSEEHVHANPVEDLKLKEEEPSVTDCSDSVSRSATSEVSSSRGEVEDWKTKEIKVSGASPCVSPVKSDVSCSVSSESPKKCIVKEENNASDCTSPPTAHSSPVLVAFQSYDSKAASSSPCLPRLKLRKSAKSNSQADAAAAAKEGEPLKPKPGRRKKKDSETAKNSVITDYFQVRRSGRQTKSEIEKEKHHQLEQMILSGCQDGLEVKEFECKGRGVVATKDFKKGDFVVEYAGDLIDTATARQREEKYAKDAEIGCYMYYFKCGAKQHCVDATAESGKLGRLLNHSSKDGNCCTHSLEVKGIARLILVAKRDITSGEELTYDYGDRSKAAIESHPWLKL